MAAIFNPTLPFNFTTNPTPKQISKHSFRPCAIATTTSSPIDVGHMQSKHGQSGVSFTGIGDSSVLRMELENGTSMNLMLPDGLITSFKSQMWHGATMELLHTFVSRGEDGGGDSALIRGGLSLALLCEIEECGVSWSPSEWTLHRVRGTPQESMQVELISRSEQGHIEVKNVITLEQDILNSEITVSNSTTAPARLVGSTVCHLAVSTPDAAYAVGLEGSDFFDRQPFQGDFNIIPPDLKKSPNKWSFNKLFPKWDSIKAENDEKGEMEGEEDDNYKHLTEKMSRIYTSAPRSLTIIDRGRRNSVTVGRKGFEEVYISSPGSEHEYYGKYSYVCVGHAAQLKPIILSARSEWTGGVQLMNPNH